MTRVEDEARQAKLPLDWQERDARGSYDEAIRVIGERVKAGEPIPDFFRGDGRWAAK